MWKSSQGLNPFASRCSFTSTVSSSPLCRSDLVFSVLREDQQKVRNRRNASGRLHRCACAQKQLLEAESDPASLAGSVG